MNFEVHEPLGGSLSIDSPVSHWVKYSWLHLFIHVSYRIRAQKSLTRTMMANVTQLYTARSRHCLSLSMIPTELLWT